MAIKHRALLTFFLRMLNFYLWLGDSFLPPQESKMHSRDFFLPVRESFLPGQESFSCMVISSGLWVVLLRMWHFVTISSLYAAITHRCLSHFYYQLLYKLCILPSIDAYRALMLIKREYGLFYSQNFYY